MKFCREWKKQRSELPGALAKGCIDYKKYKKASKQLAVDELKEQLLRDVQVCSAAFDAHQRRRVGRWSMFCMAVGVHEEDKNRDLLRFAQLNANCLRKLCKRLDKRCNTKEFTRWLNHSIDNHCYGFLKGGVLTKLEMDVDRVTCMDCPVCLEQQAKWVILKCGHYLCSRCCLEMLKIRGTVHNAIAFARLYHRDMCICPVCRNNMAFASFIGYNCKKA